jgi:L-ascorbate metabolism protein UlaG (beta-lactamase superfamily)
MELTKYEHACFTVEKDDKVLVVDPGNLSSDFIAPENVVAVVITHQHADHFDPDRLAQIFDKNDDVLVLGPADVTDKIEVENKHTAEPGEKITIGPFDLEFFGGLHALIHESYPRAQNVGVMINDLVYYPGDSLNTPNHPVDVLAIPAAAPWMKIGEAMDFLLAVKPRFAFPTHDAIASQEGKSIVDRILGGLAKTNDIDYQRLSDPIEI